MENCDVILGIEHIGIAVDNIEQAEEKYLELGYQKLHEGVLEDQKRGVKLSFLRRGHYKIELVAALNAAEKSVVDRYVNVGMGYCMYHVCYEVANMEAAISYFRKLKYAQIEEISIAQMMDGQRETYMYSKKMGLVELLESIIQ